MLAAPVKWEWALHQGEASRNRRATIGSLRREIPAEGVEDIVIAGKSWNLID
jgi:hypothetical protein